MKLLLSLLFITILMANSVFAQSAEYLEYLGLNAQNLYYYGVRTAFPNNLVADDFGPRQVDRMVNGHIVHIPYDWHGGIDFNGPNGVIGDDAGDIILAIEGGMVSPTSQINSDGFKWITIVGIHNITYEHIVADGSIDGNGLTVGGCLVKHIDGNTLAVGHRNNWAIIFRINGQYNAIGPATNSFVTFTDESGGTRTLPVSNAVAQFAPVAPLGGSGHYPHHAHIQGMSILTDLNGPLNPGAGTSDPYALNPLEYITHESPTFLINVTQQNIASGIMPVYSPPFRTPLKALVTLSGEANGSRYANSIMDIEKIEFKIARTGQSDWQNIKGPSTDRIQYGGRVTTTVKPGNLRTQGLGSWSRTGVNPYTYYTNNYDEFYFAEFYARIHKNDPMNGTGVFATYPWDARYPDGDYELKAGITNVNNTEPDNWSAISPFEIDNFKPFIRAVGVYTASVGGFNEQIYYREWISQNAGVGRLRLAGAMRRQPLFIDQHDHLRVGQRADAQDAG